MDIQPPPYIPPAVIGAPIDFKWEGARDHIGPTETVTPLLDRLAGTTTCAQITMCAGVFLWGAWRFHGLVPVEHCFELVDAAIAYQIDWRYCDRDKGPTGKVPDQPPPLSAIMKLTTFMRTCVGQRNWDSYYQPVRETFHSAHILRHILPKAQKNPFQTWLGDLADRIKQFWPKPDEDFREFDSFASEADYDTFIAPHRGMPVPLEILDPGFEFRPEMREKLLVQFLEKLDWSKNRYLRSPEDMLKLGFQGTPYKLG